MRKLNLLRTIKKSNVLLLVALFSATAAQAAGASQFYGRFSLGASIPSDLSYEGNVTNGTSATTADRIVDASLDPSMQTAVAFGFQPSGRSDQIQSRYELEIAHRQHNTNGVDFSGTTSKDIDSGGSLTVVTLFGNAYLDFNGIPIVQPYIGAGLGAAFIDQNIVYRPVGATADVSMTDTDAVFAAQLMAGVSRNLTDNLTLQADVKYLGAFDFESSRIVNGVDTGTLNTSYGETSFNIGLRYAF